MRRFIIIFFTGLTLSIIIYPASILRPADSLPDDNDTRLLTYIINQVQNNLLERKPLFFGTFFAPYQNTLTYSDPFLTTALITLPARLFTSNPVVIFNLAYLLNSTLTFTASFFFFTVLLSDNKRALIASLIFFLSGYHLTYLPHLQVFSLWATFTALAFFQLFLNRGQTLYLHLFYLFTFVQLTDSLFPVYLIFFASSIFFLTKPRHFKKILINAAPFLLCALVFSLPFLQMVRSFPEAARPIRDAAHFSLGLEEVFTKYSSWTVILLLIFSKQIKRSDLLIFATGLVLSLGPVVKLLGQTVKIFGLPIPLPYSLLYYLLPGFQGLRTPSRFILLALIAAASIIAARLPKKATPILLVLSFLLLEARLPKTGYAVNPTPPAVYEEVKKLPDGAVILELPILLWNQPNHEIESLRSLYSLYHAKRRVGGYSGFAPREWIRLVENLNARGLDDENVANLKNLDVTHVVENNWLKPLQSNYAR